MFQASIFVELGDGQKALFWTDRWLQGQSITDLAPCLCAAISPRIKKQRTVAQALHEDDWTRDISGALTVQVIMDYLLMWDLTRAVQLAPDRPDIICWKWNADTRYSTSSAYSAFFIGQHPVPGTKVLRKARAPAKCKFFIWLVLHNRCWTADRRKRHGLQDDDSCALCSQSSETIDHLLVVCPFSRELWFCLFRKVGWEVVAPTVHEYALADWWITARKQIQKRSAWFL